MTIRVRVSRGYLWLYSWLFRQIRPRKGLTMRQPFSFFWEIMLVQRTGRSLAKHPWILTGLALLIWFLAYTYLEAGTSWLASTVLHLSQTTPFGAASAFFLYEVPKVLMLLGLVVFGVGVLRSFFTPEAHAASACWQARDDRKCARSAAGNSHAFLLLLGGASVHRICDRRDSIGRDVFLSGGCPNGQ